MKQPLVSAIMPAYNQVDFVGDAIQSVVEQDYPNLQVVVSDDGSTDGTIDVILDWASRYPDRVIPIVRDGHLGVTENCNRALEQCRGELRAFHAGDDLWLPGKISRQVQWFEEDSRRILCAHDVEAFDSETGQRLFLWSEQHRPASGDDPSRFIVRWPAWHPLSHMVRATALPPGGYDPRVPVASDFKFFADCVARGGVVGEIPGTYARYRSWSGNVSRRREQMWTDLFRTLELIAEAYPWLANACDEYRAAALYDHGRELLFTGVRGEARARFLRSALLRPWPPRSLVWLAIAAMPAPMQTRVAAIRGRWHEGRR